MIQTLWGFILKEMRQTLRDPRMRLLLFIVPCLQMILFGTALSTETRNIRLATASSAADTDLDALRQAALSSAWFIDAGHDGAGDPFQLIRDAEADVVLAAPGHSLSRSKERGSGEIQALIDATNVTRAQGIDRYLAAILQRQAYKDLSRQSLLQPSPVLNLDVRILYNPSLRSAVYLVPGIMSVEICLITIILTSMSLAREKEVGTFETIIAAPIRASEVILGKTIPYVILGLVNVPLILSVAVFGFDLPMRGSGLALIGASLVFICATVSIGISISTITRTQQQAMMGGFLYLFPSLLISGLIVPVSSMPLPLQALAYVNPITYYMELLRNIMLKGGDPSLLLTDLAAMGLITIVIAMISVRRFKTTL